MTASGTYTLTAILGAGAARRFGGDKLSSDCAGKPLGQWALAAAYALGNPTIWIGPERRPDFLPYDCEYEENPMSSRGLGTSVALAARIARERNASGLLLTLADMPLVSAEMLRRLIISGPFSAFSYGPERPGVPALFPARLFSALEALDDDRGAAAILRGAADLTLVRADPDTLLDVDTLADLTAADEKLSPPVHRHASGSI